MNQSHGEDRYRDEKRRILAQILPEIQCPDDCSLCCSVAETIELSRRTGEYRHIQGDTFFCSFLEKGRCSIYERRPFICRFLYKTERNKLCPRGYLPVGGLMSKEQSRRILWCLGNTASIDDAKAIVAAFRKETP